MDLRSHYPYWLLKNGIIRSYPSLQQNASAEVAIIGAGITGALVAWHLAKEGIQTIVLDRRHVGMGSTAASTALLQYEIDTPLHLLRKKIGIDKANSSYLICRKAIYDLKDIASQFAMNADFRLSPSLQFASHRSHLKSLQLEYELRNQIGLEVEYLDEKELRKRYGFTRPGAIYSKDGGSVDSYRLTHALLTEVEGMGGKVFDHSEVTEIIHTRNGLRLKVNNEWKVKAAKLVVACGYESGKFVNRRIEKLASTYALVTEPVPEHLHWHGRSLIWETARPYLYMAITSEGKIMIGGKDSAFSDPRKRDMLIKAKSIQLTRSFQKLFPQMPVKPDFEWAGTFSNTKDGLPYIGKLPERPNTFFALGYGGNGITFSLIAAQSIRYAVIGNSSVAFDLFSFDR